MFTVEKKQLKFIRAKQNQNFDHRTIKLFHTNICEIRLDLWRYGLTLGCNLARVDYTRGAYVSSTLLRCTEEIDNISRLRTGEIFYKDLKGNSITSLMLRKEHKSAPCIQKLVGNISNPGEHFVEPICMALFYTLFTHVFHASSSVRCVRQ